MPGISRAFHNESNCGDKNVTPWILIVGGGGGGGMTTLKA